MNLQTGETINVAVPGNPSGTIDLPTLREYRERGLTAEPQYQLKANYVKSNFAPLSTYTGTRVFVHIIFGILALLLTFPSIFFGIMDAFARDDDNDIASYTDNN